MRRSRPILGLTFVVGLLSVALPGAGAQSTRSDPPDPISIMEYDAQPAEREPAPDPGLIKHPAFPTWTQVGPAYTAAGLPIGVEVNPINGQILLADLTDSIDAYDASGTSVGSLVTGLGVPVASVAANGELYIVEGTDNAVTVTDLNGTFLRGWGSAGSGDGQFSAPCDITISDSNDVYVLDANNSRIQVFNENGGFFRKWGSFGALDGQFNFACSGSALVWYNDEVFVADSDNDRVQVFDETGAYRRNFGTLGAGNGQFNSPFGIDIVKDKVYVADRQNNRIQVFTLGGIYLGKIATPSPAHVKVDPSGTVLWVSDNSSFRIYSTRTCEGKALTHAGSSFNDNFATLGTADVVHLGDGNDTVATGAGADTVCGGDGGDTINTAGGKDRVPGQNGNDTIDSGPGDDTVIGGSGKDVISGKEGADNLFGGAGGDTIFGGEDADVLNGGPAHDTLKGGLGGDELRGGGGNDTLRGQSGPDDLFGGPGNDDCVGGTGADTTTACESGAPELLGDLTPERAPLGSNDVEAVYLRIRPI